MLQGRVRGGMSDAKGVLLYTDRAWGASRIEDDGTTTASGGPLVLPHWLDVRVLSPLRALVRFHRAGAAARRFWEGHSDGDAPDRETWRFAGPAAAAAVLALAGLVTAIPGVLLPAWPVREFAQGITLMLVHLGFYAVLWTSDGNRVPMLHGAEHMCAAGLDAGQPLTRKALARFPACHPQCGSNFVITLYAVGTVVHVAIGVVTLALLPAIALRLLALPMIFVLATVAHRLLARLWDVPVIGAIAIPGRYVQWLSVAEPDAAALDVAIASARALMAADCAVAYGATDTDAERLAA